MSRADGLVSLVSPRSSPIRVAARALSQSDVDHRRALRKWRLKLVRQRGLPPVRAGGNQADWLDSGISANARRSCTVRRPSKSRQCARSSALPARSSALANGQEETLSASEFDLLKLFAEHPNKPLQRDWLLESAAHREMEPFDRAIDLRITRLRRKIEFDPAHPNAIRTVRGVGYMFVPPTH
jgi:hypothetical protein